MTLGNMRANGVRSLAAWCVGRDCHHDGVVDVEHLSRRGAGAWFGPRMRCTMCGAIGADARPNWSEAAAQGLNCFGR